jgi:hypothetical protein
MRYNPGLPKKSSPIWSLPSSTPSYPLLSVNLVTMPAFSKIASDNDDDEYNLYPEYRQNLSPSLPPARAPRRVVFKDDSPYRHHPGPMFAYGRDSRLPGSASDDPHGSGARSLENALSSQRSRSRSRSHISISSDDPNTNTTELMLLRTQNMELKLEVQHLRGNIETMSYVSANYIAHIY